MLAREPRPLPTLQLTEAGRRVTDIHDFRAEHFELSDYDPHPAIRGIPVLTDVIVDRRRPQRATA